MAIPVWPASLPQTLDLSGFSYALDKNAAIRTEVDSGPSFQRPRYSATVSKIGGQITVSQYQYQTFMAFYGTTLAHGSMPFDWVDPLTNAAATLRFDVTSPPTFRSLEPDTIAIAIALEVMP